MTKSWSALLVVCLAASVVTAGTARAEPWRGRPLVDLLESLRRDGARIVYSSLLVPPDLLVVDEPPDGAPERVLEAVLAAHGLRAEPRPGGRLVVVRAARAEPAPEGPGGDRIVVRDAIVVRPLLTVAVNVSRDGEPVRGLGVDDFRLEIGGRRQAITGLDVAEAQRARRREAGGKSLPDRRLWVLVLDTGSGGLEAWQRARRLGEILAAALGAQDRVAIAVYSPGGLRLVAARALRAEELVAALATVRAGLVGRRTIAPRERWDPRSAREGQDLPEAVQVGATGVDDAGESSLRAGWDAVADDVAGLLTALEALVSDGSGVERRKEIVLASAGFDAALVHGLRGSSSAEVERVEALQRAVERGALWRLNDAERFGHPAVARSLEETVEALQRTGSPVHVVSTASTPGSFAHDGLALLAEQSGGSYSRGPESFAQSLALHLERTSVTYLLRFRLDAKAAGSRRRKVRVEVAGPGRGLRVEVWPRELSEP